MGASSGTNKRVQHSFLFEGGIRICGDAVLRYFLVQFCSNFYFNLPYCGFKTLSSLRSRFSVKKVSTVMTLFRTAGQYRVVLEARTKCFTAHQRLLYQFTI